MPSDDLEKIFTEIIQGFTEVNIFGTPVFIKHVDLKDVIFLKKTREEYLNKAIDLGVMKEKDLLDFLNKEGTWSEEEENFVEKKEIEIRNLKKTLEKSIIKKQKKALEERIKDLEEKVESNRKKRNALVRNTAEEYADKRSNESFIQKGIYKDKNLKELYFSKEDFDELSVEDLSKIYLIYNMEVNKFNNDNLKQISIEPFFTSIYNLFGKDLSRFFEKSHFDLSHYQVNLLNFAKMFSSIFQNYEIPEDKIKDAGKILDFIEDSKNKKKTIEDSKKMIANSSGYSHAGATREDMKEAGLDVEGSVDIHKLAEKNGGELSMEDFVRFHKK